MNILFLYRSEIVPVNGGVQRITHTLADYFEHKGIKVIFVGLRNNSVNSDNHKDTRQHYLPNNSSMFGKENIDFLYELIILNNIVTIINQGARDPDTTKLAIEIKKKNNKIALLSVIHNSPLSSVYNFWQANRRSLEKFYFFRIIGKKNLDITIPLLILIYKLKYFRHYTALAKNSDKIILLSKSYIPELKRLIKIKQNDQIKVILNAVPSNGDHIAIAKKKKEILYVGRLDFQQKQIDLLLKIWEDVCHLLPEWKLNIVGDGPAHEYCVAYISSKKIPRVVIHGKKIPDELYKTSAIFSLVSSYEGLPMSLIEAISFGCVPVVFNSFSSLQDIIANHSGVIVDNNNLKFYKQTLIDLADNPNLLSNYNNNCKFEAKRFSIQTIGQDWIELISN